MTLRRLISALFRIARSLVLKRNTSGLLIAVAVIILELIGGMQAYLNQLILPIMAKDLHAQCF